MIFIFFALIFATGTALHVDSPYLNIRARQPQASSSEIPRPGWAPVASLPHLPPHEVVVLAAVEQFDNPALRVPLEDLLAAPDALPVKNILAKRKQLFLGAPGALAEQSFALAGDGVCDLGREFVLPHVRIQP